MTIIWQRVEVPDLRNKIRYEFKKIGCITSQFYSSVVCGCSTSQRIDINSLNVQQQQILDRRNKRSIVALSIEESTIGRQLDAAEKRAELYCGIYSMDNVY